MAVIETRFTTPRKPASLPMGIWIATAPGAMPATPSSAASKSARSRSSMFTTTARGSPCSAARSHSRCVCTSIPAAALITISAESTARSAVRVSPWNDGSPGVSIRLTFTPPQVRWQSEAVMLIEWRRSSSSKSDTVVPSTTLPSRLVSPAACSIASTRLVLPQPRCPSTATLRICAGSGCAMGSCLSLQTGKQSTRRVSPR